MTAKTNILAQPKRVEGPPPTQRTAGARRSEVDAATKTAMAALLQAREEWFTVAEDVIATSMIYEAFRRQGASVKVRKLLGPDGKQRTRTVDGEQRPLFNVLAMLPAGEIRPAVRKPWNAKAAAERKAAREAARQSES